MPSKSCRRTFYSLLLHTIHRTTIRFDFRGVSLLFSIEMKVGMEGRRIDHCIALCVIKTFIYILYCYNPHMQSMSISFPLPYSKTKPLCRRLLGWCICIITDEGEVFPQRLTPRPSSSSNGKFCVQHRIDQLYKVEEEAGAAEYVVQHVKCV